MNIKQVLVPESLEMAYQHLIESRKNMILGGGAWIKISVKEIDQLITLDKIGLNEVIESNDFIEIGALTTLATLENHPMIKNLHEGILSEALSQIMGVSIRNQATIGGSVMGNFSFSDILPVLLVLDVSLVFYKAGEVKLEYFMNNKTHERDILTHIKIRKTSGQGFFKKIAQTPLDFSIINLAISAKPYRIAIGSRPGNAMLCRKAMDFINEVSSINDDIIKQVIELALIEADLKDNIRSSKDYRELLIKTYLKRGIKQVIK